MDATTPVAIVASGTYFYRLRAGAYLATKQLVLLK